MNNNTRVYILISAIGIILVYLTKQWLDSQKPVVDEEKPAWMDYKFDPSTYVDPYGTTTCYPSDVERNRKKKEAAGAKQDYHPVASSKGKYHYLVTISNAHREWEEYETQTMADGSIRMRKKSTDLSYLNGTYEWDMDLYISDDNELFSYIKNNYPRMKQYKISAGASNIYDEYNDRLDDYLDDPEDEITYDPDIFYFLDD